MSSGLGYPEELQPPRTDAPIDVEAQVAALPDGARIRGLYPSDFARRIREAGGPVPAIARRRYRSFLQYPYADCLRLMVAAARACHPTLPVGEGARRLGWAAFDLFHSTRVGRALYDLAFIGPAELLLLSPRGYDALLSFGHVRAQQLGATRVRLEYRDMPALLETYQVGVVEGALMSLGREPRVLVAMDGIANALFDVRWR